MSKCIWERSFGRNIQTNVMVIDLKWFSMITEIHFTITGCLFGFAGPFLIMQNDINGTLDVKNATPTKQ